MSRKTESEKGCKVSFSITLDPTLYNKVDELHRNKSKYVEKLICEDMVKNKIITKI